MKLKFRGKVPFVISTWCLESSFVEIQNDKVYYDARIDISRGEWTESENIKKIEDYLGQIGNIITFILDFGTNDILNNNSFISSSQLIGTKGNKVKELNSILGVEFIKEINDYECLI